MKKCPYYEEKTQDEAINSVNPKNACLRYLTFITIILSLMLVFYILLGSTKGKAEESSRASQKQEDYSNYKKANFTAALFMSRAAGQHPQKQVLYGLLHCIVFQKIQNGYLLVSEDPDPEGFPSDPLFIETDEELQEGQNLFSRYAYYAGDFEYTAINGFNKRIYAFKLVP